MIVRKYKTLDETYEAMRHLQALEVNYRVECRKVSEGFSNGRRFEINFEWVLTVTHELNDPRLEPEPAEDDAGFVAHIQIVS